MQMGTIQLLELQTIHRFSQSQRRPRCPIFTSTYHVYSLECESASRRAQPGEGPSRPRRPFSVIVETNAIGNGSFAALTITIHISRTKHITIYANYLAYCSFAEGIN